VTDSGRGDTHRCVKRFVVLGKGEMCGGGVVRENG
jgi:hypothetical protein